MSIAARVKNYILENYMFTDDQEALGNAESFLEKGIIDSTGIMEVILFLEEEFGISVKDEEMVPENLDSIDNIASYIGRKTSTA